GRPLSEVIGSTGVPVGEAVRLGEQIAAALARAHESNIVHRDVKPSNVLVTPAGDAKDLDLWRETRVITAQQDHPPLECTPPGPAGTRARERTARGWLGGRPSGRAPELWRGGGADLRSDVWRCGALLYTMLAGVPPFRGATTYELSTAILTTDPPPLPDRVPL